MAEIKELIRQIDVDIEILDRLDDVDEIMKAVDALKYDIGLLKELITQKLTSKEGRA